MKIFFAFVLGIVFCLPSIFASNMADYMVSQNSYLLMYVDVSKLQKSNIYSAIKANLPAKFATSDIVTVAYPSASANGLTEKNLSELVFSVDVIQNQALDKETISYLMAFKLNKEISQDTLIKILTYDVSGKSKLTYKQVIISNLNITEIKSQGYSLFLFMPDANTVFASDSLNSIVGLSSRYKAKKPIALPERLIEQKKLIENDSVIYAIGALPPAIGHLLKEEDSEIPAANGQTQTLTGSLRIIIKNLLGTTLSASAGDSLNVKLVGIFKNASAANTINGLVNQYMPLIKIQIFMMAQNNTQIPFLNTISNSVDGNNFVLTFSISGDDIKGVLNLSESNKKLNLDVNLAGSQM